MASKKPRIGSDPLSWISDSRENSKQSKQVLQRKTTQAGLREGWTRATFIVKEEHLDKLKAYAWWERKEIKEVVDEALSAYLKDKRIKPIKKES